MKIVYRCFLVLFLSFSFQVKAQREGAIDYEKEFLGGVNFNTNGGLIGGVMFRYATLVLDSKTQFHNFNFELGIVKHPKELRYASQEAGGSYVLFKENHLVVLRPSYGREFVLFHKGNEDGVQLDFLISGGLSLGILTPYYINYLNKNTQTSDYIPYNPNDPNFNANLVLNSGGYSMGLGQSKIVPGIHARAGFSFEYGHFTNSVTGIEAGFLLEAFTEKMVMMAAPVNAGPGYEYKNKQIFSSIYVNIYYGGRK